MFGSIDEYFIFICELIDLNGYFIYSFCFFMSSQFGVAAFDIFCPVFVAVGDKFKSVMLANLLDAHVTVGDQGTCLINLYKIVKWHYTASILYSHCYCGNSCNYF